MRRLKVLLSILFITCTAFGQDTLVKHELSLGVEGGSTIFNFTESNIRDWYGQGYGLVFRTENNKPLSASYSMRLHLNSTKQDTFTPVIMYLTFSPTVKFQLKNKLDLRAGIYLSRMVASALWVNTPDVSYTNTMRDFWPKYDYGLLLSQSITVHKHVFIGLNQQIGFPKSFPYRSFYIGKTAMQNFNFRAGVYFNLH